VGVPNGISVSVLTRVRLTARNRPRGDPWVDTLVVFIAVILVATIAATVLIDTAGVLRIQASDTSSASQGMVSSQIDIEALEGEGIVEV